jgi:hypothetical protein
LSRPTPSLDDFEVVDDLTARLGSGQLEAASVDSEGLSLGPFLEAVTLRKRWAGLELSAMGGERYTLLKAAVRAGSASAYNAQFGAFYIGEPGERADNNAVAFGEELARRVEHSGLAATPRQLLKGATVELITNVHQHAGARPRGVAAFELFPGGVAVSVADAGQGVVAGYVSVSPELKGLTADAALEMAVVQHKSRLHIEGKGTGFMTVAHAMRSLDATLRVRSGDASIEIGGHPDEAEWLLREQVDLRGFVVSLTLRWT